MLNKTLLSRVTCPAAETFLTRTSGLTGAEKARYRTLICGLVADGLWSNLVALYVLAAPNAAAAALNLCNANFTLSISNSPTFTPNRGYTGNTVSNSLIDTGLVLSTVGAPIALNSTSIGFYDLTPGTTATDVIVMGAESNSTNDLIDIFPMTDFFGLTTTVASVNEGGFVEGANTQNAGLYVASRTAVNAEAVYKNGVLIATSTGASSNLPDLSIALVGANNPASDGGPVAAPDTGAFAFIGSGLSASQVAQISARINAFATSLAINVY